MSVLLKEWGPSTVGTLEPPLGLQHGHSPDQPVQVFGAVMDRQGKMANVGDYVELIIDDIVS